MSPLSVAISLLFVTFGSYLVGGWLRIRHHKSFFSDATIGTINNTRMALLVLAMFSISAIMVSSKAGFENKAKDLRVQASKFIYLDQIFKEIGPKAEIARKAARDFLNDEIQIIDDAHADQGQTKRAISGGQIKPLFASVQAIEASTDLEKDLKSIALSISHEVASSRWITVEELGSGILWPMILLLGFWLIIIFVSFGVVSTLNIAEVVYFFMLAFSISAAVYLPLELDLPFRGVIHVSHEPLLIALNSLSK